MNPRSARVAVAALLVVGACGTSSGETLQSPAGAPDGSTTTTVEPTTTTPDPTTTVEASVEAAQTDTLPGEPAEGFIPGTVAHVAGVGIDETFDITTVPGDDEPAAASFPPLTELVFTGNGREIDVGTFSKFYAEVTVAGVTGWISRWELVYLGAPDDETADAVATLGGIPRAPSMRDLGTIVMDAVAPLDPDSGGAALVLAAESSAGSTSELVYDHFPGEKFGDDVANGARHWVVGRQVPATDLPETGLTSSLEYELVSVEARVLCTRGVDSRGICV